MELILGVIQIVFSVIVGFTYVCVVVLATLGMAAILMFVVKGMLEELKK